MSWYASAGRPSPGRTGTPEPSAATPTRLFVSGHSAGGHLTAMAAATDWSAFAGLPADTIKGGCGISGLYDLEPIRLSYLNDTLRLTPDEAGRNSPILLTPPPLGAASPAGR